MVQTRTRRSRNSGRRTYRLPTSPSRGPLWRFVVGHKQQARQVASTRLGVDTLPHTESPRRAQKLPVVSAKHTCQHSGSKPWQHFRPNEAAFRPPEVSQVRKWRVSELSESCFIPVADANCNRRVHNEREAFLETINGLSTSSGCDSTTHDHVRLEFYVLDTTDPRFRTIFLDPLVGRPG